MAPSVRSEDQASGFKPAESVGRPAESVGSPPPAEPDWRSSPSMLVTLAESMICALATPFVPAAASTTDAATAST